MPPNNSTHMSRRGLARLAASTLAAAMVATELEASAQSQVDPAESIIAEVEKTRGKPLPSDVRKRMGQAVKDNASNSAALRKFKVPDGAEPEMIFVPARKGGAK